MKFLVVGLGSMGKRRIRCLQKLGYTGITALDFREDRRKEAADKYGVKTVSDLKSITLNDADAMIISTPPDKHDDYIKLAVENGKPAFVEASVVLGELEMLNEEAKRRKVFIAPSCTLKFHPAIKEIIKIAKGGAYGRVTNFTYHSGQYLPDWHPYENVKDFYVSKKETGAAREIVPFELAWLVELAGFPAAVKGYHGKTMDVGADIDDTYTMSLKLRGGAYASVIVDVVCRYATRILILNLERAQLLWRWDEPIIKLYEVSGGNWKTIDYKTGEAADGYNKNIAEDMYVDELGTFIAAAQGKGKFPNDLDEDIAILKLLAATESSNEK